MHTSRDLSRLLRARRQAIGWTLPELADRSGVSVNTARRALQGRNVRWLTIEAIAGAMALELRLQPPAKE